MNIEQCDQNKMGLDNFYFTNPPTHLEAYKLNLFYNI